MMIFVSRDEEHALILQYCQTLGAEAASCSQPQSPTHTPKSHAMGMHGTTQALQSPAQILQAVEKEERGELERIITRLEEEQRYADVLSIKTYLKHTESHP